MKYAARALGLATLAVAALAASSVAHAQPAACQDSVELPPWTPGVTSNFVDGGATGDESAGYTICSSAPGPSDPYDSYRLLTQPAGGDFELEATVESLSAGGAGGLVATVLGLDLLTAARVLIWVETDTDDPSIAWLRSSIRREDDGASEPEPAPIMVTLPLRLHLARTGGVLSAGFRVDGILTDHLVADITGEQLDVALRVGMQQFSGEPDVTHFAVFQRPSLVAARVPEVDCIEGSPFASGALHVSGKNLDSVTAISAFGGPVVLLAQSPERLILQPAAPPAGGVNYGQLELGHAASRLPLRVDIASIGTPLIRGDVDMDGDVDLDDFRDLRRWMNRGVEPACPGAGDVNGDTFTNQTDVDALKAWLKGTGHRSRRPLPGPRLRPGRLHLRRPGRPRHPSRQGPARQPRPPRHRGRHRQDHRPEPPAGLRPRHLVWRRPHPHAGRRLPHHQGPRRRGPDLRPALRPRHPRSSPASRQRPPRRRRLAGRPGRPQALPRLHRDRRAHAGLPRGHRHRRNARDPRPQRRLESRPGLRHRRHRVHAVA